MQPQINKEIASWLTILETERETLLTMVNGEKEKKLESNIKQRLYQIEAWLDGIYANHKLRW